MKFVTEPRKQSSVATQAGGSALDSSFIVCYYISLLFAPSYLEKLMIHLIGIFKGFTIIGDLIKRSNIKLIAENPSYASKTPAKLRPFL